VKGYFIKDLFIGLKTKDVTKNMKKKLEVKNLDQNNKIIANILNN